MDVNMSKIKFFLKKIVTSNDIELQRYQCGHMLFFGNNNLKIISSVCTSQSYIKTDHYPLAVIIIPITWKISRKIFLSILIVWKKVSANQM